jgi:hypothetical protein
LCPFSASNTSLDGISNPDGFRPVRSIWNEKDKEKTSTNKPARQRDSRRGIDFTHFTTSMNPSTPRKLSKKVEKKKGTRNKKKKSDNDLKYQDSSGANSLSGSTESPSFLLFQCCCLLCLR